MGQDIACDENVCARRSLVARGLDLWRAHWSGVRGMVAALNACGVHCCCGGLAALKAAVKGRKVGSEAPFCTSRSRTTFQAAAYAAGEALPRDTAPSHVAACFRGVKGRRGGILLGGFRSCRNRASTRPPAGFQVSCRHQSFLQEWRVFRSCGRRPQNGVNLRERPKEALGRPHIDLSYSVTCWLKQKQQSRANEGLSR